MQNRTALITTFDKTGIIDFAKRLKQLSFRIISTGKTWNTLSHAGISAETVSEYTATEELLDGRVKTLHPKIFAGLLARKEKKNELDELATAEIAFIDLVIVNLYPFEKVKNKKISLEQTLDYIDIGGISLIRAAAKNFSSVTTVCEIDDYERVVSLLETQNCITSEINRELAIKAFQLTSQYDKLISEFLLENKNIKPQKNINFDVYHKEKLRYGENPQQKASFYSTTQKNQRVKKISGIKDLSYNNYLDIDIAKKILLNFKSDTSAAVVIKHNIPCGMATGSTITQSVIKAWEGDPISAFGGVVAVNKPVDLEMIQYLRDNSSEHFTYAWDGVEFIPQKISKKFVDLLIAPSFDETVIQYLQDTQDNIRLAEISLNNSPDFKQDIRILSDGILVQENIFLNEFLINVTDNQPPFPLYLLAKFGIIAALYAKSNACVLVREYEEQFFQLIGMGNGQPNRISSMLNLAIPQAKRVLKNEYEKLEGTSSIIYETWEKEQLKKILCVSDGFFPFTDIIKVFVDNKIQFIVQPGGSKQDKQVIDMCRQYNIIMFFTQKRYFKH